MKIWAVLSAETLTDRIRSLLDKGEFAEATRIHSAIDGFCEMIEKHLQKEAGSIYCLVPDRIVITCSVEMAEQIPLFVSGYKDQTRTSIACGIGLSYEEASKAMIRSRGTKEIEMYEKDLMKGEEFELELPINTSDPKSHEYKENIKPQKGKEFVPAPSVEEELKLQTQYLAQLVQAMSGQPAQPQMPQQQAPAQQQEQQGQAPQRSLYESLLGQQAPEEAQGQPQEQATEEAPQAPEAEAKAEGEEGEVTPEEKSELDKIGASLVNIKEQIPQLMDLANHNPQAFKQAMSLVQKMLTLASKKIAKSQEPQHEELIKKLNDAITNERIYPIGTVKNRKKKIALNDRASWRSVSSGMIKDTQGNPVSVKSHNAKADPNDDIPIK